MATVMIPYPIVDGLMIYVDGDVDYSGDRFDINLMSNNGDIAYHFNPRFEGQSGVVVRNSLLNGSWGVEERNGPYFPFVRGQRFQCIILIQNPAIKTAVNGSHFCEYSHRIYKESIQTVTVSGCVHGVTVNFQPGQTPPGYPPTAPPPSYTPAPSYTPSAPVQPAVTPQHQVAAPAKQTLVGSLSSAAGSFAGDVGKLLFGNSAVRQDIAKKKNQARLAVPFHRSIPGGLCPGRIIRISGVARQGYDDRFVVDLVLPNGNIVLHISVRLPESVVVCNTQTGGIHWGTEQRSTGGFPFDYNHAFDLVIECNKFNFMIRVNGNHLMNFPVRIGRTEQIRMLKVTGSVELTNVST